MDIHTHICIYKCILKAFLRCISKYDFTGPYVVWCIGNFI